MTNTRYLLGDEVHFLFNEWLRRPTEPTSLCMFCAQPASPGSESDSCCLSPVDLPTHGIGVSLDLAAVELVHLLREFKSSSRDYQFATQVVNTEESTSYGYH